MNETPKKGGKPARDGRAGREARLAEALRANLKRRKAQERGRAAGTETKAGETAAPDGDKDENAAPAGTGINTRLANRSGRE